MPIEPSSTLVWTSQNEAVYILAPQQRGAEGDDRGVVAAQDLPHGAHPSDGTRRGRELDEYNRESAAHASTPVDDLQATLARRHGAGQRADPRADGERARPAHPRGDGASGRGRRQAAAAAADPRRGPALRLRRRPPPAARRDRRVHPHRDAAARRRRRRERAAARPADRQPALGQQVERAGRRLPVRPRLPADGRDRLAPGARHPRQRLGGDRRGRGAAADGGGQPRHRRGDLPPGGARQDRGALRRRLRGRRGDRRRARAAGRRRSAPTATRSASPSRSPTTCSTTAASPRRSARTSATTSASARSPSR